MRRSFGRGVRALGTFLGILLALSSLSTRALAQTCSASVTTSLVATGFNAPTDIKNAGDGRLFVVEQAGKIRILSAGSIVPTPFLDLTTSVVSGGERGLVSLAFHPNYPATPWFYVYYTNADTSVAGVGDIVVARYSVSSNPNVADPSSRRVLFTVPHSAASNHNGGTLQFSPADGFLYVSLGDGGGACDSTGCNAQNGDSLLGKILRLDVNVDVAPFYAIPASNPFVGPGTPRDEIWAKGLRNPFRVSFDRANGNLWIGDVGQDAREEIDFQPAVLPIIGR